MPKYWVRNYFTHGRFSKVGQKQKTEKKKKKKKERLNNGDNNGQATHGARKHAWRTQAPWANKCCQAKIKIKLAEIRLFHKNLVDSSNQP